MPRLFCTQKKGLKNNQTKKRDYAPALHKGLWRRRAKRLGRNLGIGEKTTMKTTTNTDATPVGWSSQFIQINTLYDSFEGRRSDWHEGAKVARLSDNELWQDLVFEARDHEARDFLNACMLPSDALPCRYFTDLLPEDTAKLCAGLLGVGTANEVQGIADLSESAQEFLRKRALWAVLCVDPSFWECDPNDLCF